MESKLAVEASREAQLKGERGLSFFARGDLLRAESELRLAHLADPTHAPWLFHLARVYLRMDRDFEAMECLREGVAIMPDATCLIRLAHLEQLYDAPDNGLQAALEGLRLDPRDTMGQVIAAQCLTDLGRNDEAKKHWESAARLATPNGHLVRLTRARHAREHGQFDLAIDQARHVLGERPDCAGALALLAESSRAVNPDPSLLRQMEDLAQRSETPANDRVTLEFAVGKVYGDLEQYRDAMIWFDRANATALALRNSSEAFNRDAYARSIQARTEIFSHEVVSKTNDVGSRDGTPIFVVGMIRSGTTLVEQILTRHSDVSGAGEQKFWLSVEPTFIDLRSRKLERGALEKAASTYTRILERYRRDARHVVDKQPGNLLLAGALHLAFPNARIIYLHRGALDNAVSIWTTHIQTALPFMHDKASLAFAIQQHELLMNHWQTVLPTERFMVLPYESLVQDQQLWTRNLVEFCGLPWEEACLTPEKSQSKVATPSSWQVRQPVYSTSVGRWKNYEPWLGPFEVLRETQP